MSESSNTQPEWKTHFDRGMSAGGAGDLAAAERHFAKAVEIAPEEPYPHYELGYTLSRLGRHAEALAELRRANELSRGFFLVQTEIYLCEQVLTRQIDDGTLSTLRRIQQLVDTGGGASPEALSLSQQVIDAAPRCAMGHYFLGKVLGEQDRARSESALRRCTELSPDDTTAIDAFTHIGFHREAAGDTDAARRLWTDVVSRYRENPHTAIVQAILDQRAPASQRDEPDGRAASQAPGASQAARELTEDEINEHDLAVKEGWSLVEGQLLLGGADPSRKPGLLARRRLHEAKSCFETALGIVPDSWQSLWALGKIHQRLGELPEALDHLARAHEIDPSQPDVAREAGIAATDIGDGPAAVRFTKAAIAAKPGDPGLVSNLAMALLIDGDVEGARAAAGEAASRAPSDPITNAVRDLVEEVAQGKRPRPASGLELR